MQKLATLTYDPLKQIGAGQGMNSKVYLSTDPQLGGAFAVKEIPKASLGNSITGFFQEATTMFACEHPNVVPIQYACETPTDICLAMRYFPRGSLSDRIAAGPMQLGPILKMMREVLSGLGHIHSRGFVHLDMKPSNVLFSDTDQAMVADFGQSRRTVNGIVQGPRMYIPAMPPEMFTHHVAIVPSDVYHAGLLLYRAVNGDSFYKSQIPADVNVLAQKIVDGKFPNRLAFMPHVPKRVRTIIRTALKVNPAERYQTAREMSDALAKVRVPNDWKINATPSGAIEWRVDRPGQPALAVKLDPSGAGWCVAIQTEGPGGTRAKNKKDWRGGITRSDADDHLKKVFEALG
jgi:serine/threonine protein kinase